MSRKRFLINGKYFRERRGKLVKIPGKWLGKVNYLQTLQKRRRKNKKGRLTLKGSGR